MLPNKNRLSLKNRLGDLRHRGILMQNPFFGLLYLKENIQKDACFAFIVSNKIAPHAVIRNKIRRLLSEAIQKELKQIKEGVEAVFLVKKSIVGQDFNSIQVEVKNLFNRAKLYKNENSFTPTN